MYIGNVRRIIFVFVLVLLELSLIGQKVHEDSRGKYFLKADTTYSDTVIGGRSVVIRNITIYDTVYIMPENSMRKLNFSIPSPSFSELDSNIEPGKLPGIMNWEFETGISYGAGFPFQPKVGYHDALKSIENISFFEGFLHGAWYNKNWYFKSGLNLSYTRERLNYSKNVSETDSLDFYTYSYDTIKIDTSYYLNLLLLPDSVYIMFIDTSPYLYTDTLFRNKIRTIKSEPIARYFRIGVPVLVGHVFEYKKFDLAIETGFYFNMLVNVNGKTVDYHNNLRQLNHKYLYRFSNDFALRMQFRYKLKSLRYVTLTPVVRYNLWDVYSDPEFVRRKNLSFRFAIGYNFY
jgi:hypothetical protein